MRRCLRFLPHHSARDAMAAEEDGASREFDPSQRRLDQAREKGEAIRSEEAQAAIAFGALLLVFSLTGATLLEQGGTGLRGKRCG